ncbi:MAG TPA: hypothetical protein VMH41_09145 [Mycobacteriales bacterium]|nr:hypothetical protein [Mycobacteriales bacterium]
MIEAIVARMRARGESEEFVSAVRSDLPRWARQLAARGLSAWPQQPKNWREYVDHAADDNFLVLLIERARRGKDRNEALLHDLRNMARVRPPKPWSTFKVEAVVGST